MYIAEQLALQVAQGNYADVEQRLADHLKASLPMGAIQATWQGLEQQFGAFVGVSTTVSVQTPQGLEQSVTCIFARAPVDVSIVLNGAGEITGFRVTPQRPSAPSFGPYPGRSPAQRPQRPPQKPGCLLRGCLIGLGLLVLLVGGTWLMIQSLQNNPSFVSFFSSHYDTLGVLLGIACFAILPVALLAGRRTALGKMLAGGAVALVLIVIVGFLLVAFIPPHIGLTRTGFNIPSLEIGNGTVTFDNPGDGVTQTLCVGRDQHCVTDPNVLQYVPSQLAQGLVLHPGQSVTLTFGVGEFHITSKNTPHMNLIITKSYEHSSKGNRPPPLPIYGTASQNGPSVPF